MDAAIRAALQADETIDLTTTGRRSGRPQRIEIWFRRIGQRYFITGTPGPRDWYANMLANPAIIFHLKGSIQADLPARVEPVTDPDQRKEILSNPVMDWYHHNSKSIESFIRDAPLVEVHFEPGEK